jgi:uncharacterized protein YlxW (UPF0749 family)
MPEVRSDYDAARAASADRARMPLLTLITQESLDEDYQHVARTRATAGVSSDDGTRRRSRWVATAVVAAFGMLVAVAAVQTSNSSGITSANRESLLSQIEGRRAESAARQGDLVRLRARNIGLQDDLDAVSAEERAAANRARRLAAQSGYGPVTGPGVVITVDDAPTGEAVQDEDLALLVNGLWAAGAEAISINGKRLTALSALRNAGAAINLNGSPMSPPYVVSAIGDSRTLPANLLDTTTGLEFTNLAGALGFPVTRQNADHLELPAGPQRQLQLGSVDTEDDKPPPGKEPPP